MNDPILLDIPEQIETERLILRAPRAGDGAEVNAAVVANLEHLRPWMPWAATVMTAAEQEIWARKQRILFLRRDELPFLIFWKATNRYIGGTGFHNINWYVPRLEMGYWLAKEVEGNGVMSEAVQALTHFAFETLAANRIEIRCDVNNERSAAVARRAGYTHEGTLFHNARHHLTNDLRSTHVFAKTRGE